MKNGLYEKHGASDEALRYLNEGYARGKVIINILKEGN